MASLVFVVIAAVLVFFYLIWGGIEWITSGEIKAKQNQLEPKSLQLSLG
jgi:hypothetical protein